LPEGNHKSGKFIGIIANFGDCRGCKTTLLKPQGEIWHEGADLEVPLPLHAESCKKKLLKGIDFLLADL